MSRTLELASAAILALATVGASPVAAGQDPTEPRPVPDARMFTQKASAINLAEITLGNLARKRAASEEVKKYAKHLVEDHKKASQELGKVADQENLTVAAAMSPKDQALFQKLSALAGAEFDRAFVQAMIKGHQEAIGLFKIQVELGQDKALKKYAAATLPTLREHLRMAASIVSSLQGDQSNPARRQR